MRKTLLLLGSLVPVIGMMIAHACGAPGRVVLQFLIVGILVSPLAAIMLIEEEWQ